MPHRYCVNNILHPNLDYLRFITTSFLLFKYGESAVYSGDAAVSSRCKSVFDDNCKSKSIAYFCEKILQAPSSLTPWHTVTHEMDFVSCWVHGIQFIVPFIKCGKYESNMLYIFFLKNLFRVARKNANQDCPRSDVTARCRQYNFCNSLPCPLLRDYCYY